MARTAVPPALAANPRLAEITRREEERVAKVVADHAAWLAEQSFGAIDPHTGEPRRVRPTDIIAQRREWASNGMPGEETTDTIGKLWAFGLLDNGEFAADLLRDAGRRYAASYWRRFGPVCARSGAYAEMTGRSSGGPPAIVIPDAELDALAEQRFRDRDDALRAAGRMVKKEIDLVCVDGQGDNDPTWLLDLMNGYPRETREARLILAAAEAQVPTLTGEARRKAIRRYDDARRALAQKQREARIDRLPHSEVHRIVTGLVELARIDRREGLHRPKRTRKPEEGD